MRPPARHVRGCAPAVRASAVDLILWDSRTVHGGVVGTGDTGVGSVAPGVADSAAAAEALTSGGAEAAAEPCPLARLSMTVCMTPRAWAPHAVLKDRSTGFRRGAAFTHWPHEARAARASAGPSYTPIELTPEQLALL